MSTLTLSGNLVRLTLMQSEEDLLQWSTWYRNGDFSRFLDANPALLYTPAQIKSWLEADRVEFTLFGIRTLAEDKLIGFVDLDGFDWVSRSAWTAIGIGGRDNWGKGYGTEAMRLLLRYAFATLNLNRVNLDVFGYNQRAYRSYVKCGFKEEGRERQALNRFNQRWDTVYMGILREEWADL